MQASFLGRWPPPKLICSYSTDEPFLVQLTTPIEAQPPQCQLDDNQLMDQTSKSSSLHSPISPASQFVGFTDKMEALDNAGTPTSSHCHVVGFHTNQAHSVTPTLLIMKTTKRENSFFLPILMRLIRPARSPWVCLISLPHLPS